MLSCPLKINRATDLCLDVVKKLEVISPEKLFSQSFDYLSINKSDQEPKEDRLLPMNKDNILEKNWVISSIVMEKVFNYGPINSFKLFSFLREMYSKMSEEEKEKKRFLIVDTACDIHYQPETVYEMLKEDYDRKSSLKAKFKPLEPERGDIKRSKFDSSWKRRTDSVDENNYTSVRSAETCADSNLSSRTPKRKKKERYLRKTNPMGIRVK